MERISVGGIPFVRAEKAVLVAHLCERAEKREGESVFTPNAEMAARAGRSSRATSWRQYPCVSTAANRRCCSLTGADIRGR